MLEVAKITVEKLLEADPDILSAENLPVKTFLNSQKGKTKWSKIA